LGATQIYVSRGIGTIVLPLRWRCPAEVPLLELEPHRREEGRSAGHYVQRDTAFPSNVSALNIAAD